MKYFKTTLIIFSLFFNCSYSFGQSFSLLELIKMSKMDMDTFDTYISSKGFVFFGGKEKENIKGVTYAFNLSEIDNSKAEKWVSLYEIYFEKRYSINYQTHNKSEYLKIKNQIKQFGFKLTLSEVFTDNDGSSSNYFEYRKGKSEVSIFANSRGYEISYEVDN